MCSGGRESEGEGSGEVCVVEVVDIAGEGGEMMRHAALRRRPLRGEEEEEEAAVEEGERAAEPAVDSLVATGGGAFTATEEGETEEAVERCMEQRTRKLTE